MDQSSSAPSSDEVPQEKRKIKQPVRRLQRNPSSIGSQPTFPVSDAMTNNLGQPPTPFHFGGAHATPTVAKPSIGFTFGTPSPFQATSSNSTLPNTSAPVNSFSSSSVSTPLFSKPVTLPEGLEANVFNFGPSSSSAASMSFSAAPAHSTPSASMSMSMPVSIPVSVPVSVSVSVPTTPTPSLFATQGNTPNTSIERQSSSDDMDRKRKESPVPTNNNNNNNNKMRHGPSPLSRFSFVASPAQTPSSPFTAGPSPVAISNSPGQKTLTPGIGFGALETGSAQTETKAPSSQINALTHLSFALTAPPPTPSTTTPSATPTAPTAPSHTDPKISSLGGDKDKKKSETDLAHVFNKPASATEWKVTETSKVAGQPVFGDTSSGGSNHSILVSTTALGAPTTLQSLITKSEEIVRTTRFSELPSHAMIELIDLEQLIIGTTHIHEMVDAQVLARSQGSMEHIHDRAVDLTKSGEILKEQLVGESRVLEELFKDITFQKSNANTVKIFLDNPTRKTDAFTNNAHWDYFIQLGAHLQKRTQEYAQTVENIEKAISHLSNRETQRFPDVGSSMAIQNKMFLSLAGKVAAMHEEVEHLKSEAKKTMESVEH
ncbi:hypothetical protein BDF14DRAFT_1041638 [Spinellus fusiger]|nr:hypothetical protein BDF14DRAFT_1041638 [Spinellus fusiger]